MDKIAGESFELTRAPRSEQVRSVMTRSALVATAREMFGSQGYHATGTTDIVVQAGVTRGALYHHFASKEGLFEAVYRIVASELSELARNATLPLRGQTWARMLASVRANLSFVASNRGFQRILLIDGPAVFGWARWRELQGECRLAGWLTTIDLLVEQGLIEDLPRETLAHMIMALHDDAAMSLAHADDPEAALRDVTRSLEALLRGLMVKP